MNGSAYSVERFGAMQHGAGKGEQPGLKTCQGAADERER
jgi:hypothetical protein